MVDINQTLAAALPDRPVLRQGVESFYFAYREFTKGPDAILAALGFGRAHHRALHFIARMPGLTVSDLLKTLRITKQSLSRVLTDLQAAGHVEQSVGASDRRQRHLALTASGMALEQALFASISGRMATAFAEAGPEAAAGFLAVLQALIGADERQVIDGLMAAYRR